MAEARHDNWRHVYLNNLLELSVQHLSKLALTDSIPRKQVKNFNWKTSLGANPD
jgi:hypothetical protein